MEFDSLFRQGERTEQQIKNLIKVENIHAKTLEKRYSELVEHIQRLYHEINETTQHVLEHKDKLLKFKIDLNVEINKIREMQENHGILLMGNSKGIQELLKRTEEMSINLKENKEATQIVLRTVLSVLHTQEDISSLIVDIENGNRTDHPEIADLLKRVIRLLETGDKRVKKVKNECVAFYMTFPTISSWVQFVKDCLNGSLVDLFLPLETYLRTLPRCAHLKLKFGITEHDFLAYADHLLKTLKCTIASDITQNKDNVRAIELVPSHALMSEDYIKTVMDAHAVRLDDDSNDCDVKAEHFETVKDASHTISSDIIQEEDEECAIDHEHTERIGILPSKVLKEIAKMKKVIADILENEFNECDVKVEHCENAVIGLRQKEVDVANQIKERTGNKLFKGTHMSQRGDQTVEMSTSTENIVGVQCEKLIPEKRKHFMNKTIPLSK
ncbi:uncharacterized protein LOC127848670 [Dreissena polymorpha]|uniref:uncharacterized protein LOC127848670 n=1 Tax=Dreissena polymorpha TaxID=45954 RepID=UPI002263EAE2|nr:uncharacterized protein LOC127848670 [Dreissena polymorpha]